MPTVFPALRSMQECKLKLCILAIIAILAAILGAAFAAKTDHTYILMMCRALAGPVSIVGSALIALLFLVSCYFVIHSKPWLVYFICGVWLFLLTSALWAIRAAFGSAGWLISFFLQFPTLLYCPMLLYVAIRRFTGQSIGRLLKYVVIVGLAAGMINYAVISPFLADFTALYETMGRYAIHVGLNRCI